MLLAVIPARWASTRFPGKPLRPIAGKPLVQHVWERCRESRRVDAVVIATDDGRIANAAKSFGADVALTSPDHPSGTDRLAEVARQRSDVTHFLNVQGDEPAVPPALIDLLADALLADSAPGMVTAATPLRDAEEYANPNCVKAILTANGDALYFSRAPIPHGAFANGAPIQPPRVFRHQGIYGYARDFLLRFVAWPPSPLEQTERLEQLRALENGARIRVLVTDFASPGVDSPDDIPRAEAALAALLKK